jgi:hypothetical protein
MAGDIHKAEPNRLAVTRYRLKGSKSKIDADAAPFLLRQTVSVNAGQPSDKSSLPVIDMSGGPDYNRLEI